MLDIRKKTVTKFYMFVFDLLVYVLGWFDSLSPSQKVLNHVRRGLPGLNRYKAADNTTQ